MSAWFLSYLLSDKHNGPEIGGGEGDGSEVGNRMNTSCIVAGNKKILSPSDALFISHLFPSSHMTRMND
jgi:hypothetical protein